MKEFLGAKLTAIEVTVRHLEKASGTQVNCNRSGGASFGRRVWSQINCNLSDGASFGKGFWNQNNYNLTDGASF